MEQQGEETPGQCLAAPRQGDWFQSVRGRRIYPLDPRSEDVDVEEIAHALSFVCRFGGHVLGDKPYSVAEHSVYVSRCVAETHPELALVGLLHDAPEAYLGDVIRPLKRGLLEVGAAYADAEHAWARVIGVALGLGNALAELPAAVKVADDRVLMAERRALLAPPPAPWRERDYQPYAGAIIRWSPREARERFLAEYLALAMIERPWWVSWWSAGSFTLATPWWVSGERLHGQESICAAVMAKTVEGARDVIRRAHDAGGEGLEFRFEEPRLPSWTPYSDRFPRAKWMRWPT